ncbi:lipid II flippase Amj family protein [Hathewaya histolytica]|uniref:lipid II flippase Amj family protein n=1 Tax=Hathewaya histolytica TaxID=1498 RepID=UPI003B67FDBF
MSTQIAIVLTLTIVIYIISTLAYSVRIVGVKTGRIAISFAVFNVFALISRTANTIQAPLMAKTIENSIKTGNSQELLNIFRCIIASTTLATIIGALLMPTFIKLFSKAVDSFSVHKSIPRVLIHGFSKSGIEQFKNSITLPRRGNIPQLKQFKSMPEKIIVLNTIAFSISVVGVLASLYAGCLNPDLRTTCSTLSSVINGISTILMFIFIDPYISMLTDDVIRGECSEGQFNRCITFVVAGLILGTILAQFLLVPAARTIEYIARVI